MPRVMHFEIPADNPEQIIKFYQDVFGWEINKWGEEPYWLVRTGQAPEPGIDGAIYKKDWMTAVVNTVTVDSLEKYIENVKASGGTIVREPMEIPGVGRHAVAKDPEGTLFGIMQPDPNQVMM